MTVLCLDIWRGSKSGPAIHSMQATFSIGALTAPIVSRPFLSVEQGSQGGDAADLDEREFTESHIDQVYLYVGAAMLAVSTGFLYLGARSLVRRRRVARTGRRQDESSKAAPVVYDRREKIIVLLSIVSVLCFVGGEFGIFNFLPAFVVRSKLGLTKAQGVHILAVYFLTYALSRISCFFLTFW